MPTYEYECKTCGYTFDAFQNMSDAPLKTCPQCGKDIRRLINGGMGIIFKGSGFYVNDKKSGSAKGGGSSSSSKSSSKSEPAASPAPESPSCPACPKAETSSCPKAANG